MHARAGRAAAASPSGPDGSAADPGRQDVIPGFHDRNHQGLPVRWINRIRRAMATLIPKYTTDRMVAEYTEKYYKVRH